MKAKTGEYIPRGQVGQIVTPDAGTDEVIVTATRLPNWPLYFFIAAALYAVYEFFGDELRD